MTKSQAFPSTLLKVEDLAGKPVTLTMDHVELQELQGDRGKETKPILSFRKTDKKMVVNSTNWNTISSLYGEESDNWVGQRITLVPREVDFKGKMTMAIRVSIKKPDAVAAAPVAKAAPVAEQEPEPTPEELGLGGEEDSQVPF